MLEQVEHIIGYCFKDKTILKEALTHKSFAGEHRGIRHNERLEFLGDSILGAIVADYIYNQCPHDEEGVLSKIKSNLVSRKNLYLWGKKLQLGTYMYLGHGELATGGRERDSIISNAVEAVIGAVYLDGGYPAAQAFILPWAKTQKLTEDTRDYKSILQEFLQKKGPHTPIYEVSESHIKKILADPEFMSQIREKFFITLSLDEDNYYLVIALIMAYLYHQNGYSDGYSAQDIFDVGNDLDIKKISNLEISKISAFMEELEELNVFRKTDNSHFLFTRFTFFQMMGTGSEVEDKLANFMEA